MNKKVFYITIPTLFIIILVATIGAYKILNPKSSTSLPADEYVNDEPEEYVSPSPQPCPTVTNSISN
ncbi:MAG: hypothetical protein OEV37_00560 [Candidatus Berkelbacteria bacterium]|nr:hypothetical protein [Candidatus Berkelbacteria bacterium]